MTLDHPDCLKEEYCEKCQTYYCVRCQGECFICLVKFCLYCSKYCQDCGLPLCFNCLLKCVKCNDISCHECIRTNVCETCFEEKCGTCLNEINISYVICKLCRQKICPDCLHTCDECNSIHCVICTC